jgi:outer membrane lipoprotein carrier protein
MRLFPCVVLLCGWAAMAAPAGDDRVNTFLASTSSLRASFEQEVVGADGALLESSSGTLVLKRPGKFRWDYTRPFERQIVADGTRVWLYEADLEQVTVRRLAEGLGDTPAAILTGRDDVLKRFRVARAWRDAGIDWVRLEPLATDADFAAVTLGFDADRLTRMTLDDRLGQQTRVRLTGVEQNIAVPEQAFVFVTPPGADVIDDTEL